MAILTFDSGELQTSAAGWTMEGYMIELVLDTDIGTDVDDLMALAMTFGSPELSLER